MSDYTTEPGQPEAALPKNANDFEVDENPDREFTAPDRPVAMDRFGTTAYEYATGENLSRRLAEEEPEEWDERAAAPQDEDSIGVVVDEEAGEAGHLPAGRLVADGELSEGADAPDTWARGLGEDGVDSSPEEEAMHVIDEA